MSVRFLLPFLCLPAVLAAQITGELRGTVNDPSGAAVPGAKVLLTSTETGETRDLTTDAEGRFAFPLLKIGDYSIAVEATGFRRTVGDASVRSAEITSVSMRLEVGQVNEQVVVTDFVTALDTQSAQLQESFQSKQVAEIPVARNPNLLASTLPGITPAPGTFNSGSFVSHGNRVRANNITIDNITATDISVAGTGSSNNGPLNFSSLKEVKIITHNFSAEFGRNSGAQLQYITKSGTNDFHGEVYDYFRNNVLNSRDWFDRSGKSTVTRVNQFGGVLGGPIVRNKTHFFLASELGRVRGLGAARIAQVPTSLMIAQVTDLTSKKLLDQFQLPAATTDQGTFGTVQQNASTKSDTYQYSVRIDHQLSSKDSIYGRFGTYYGESSSSNNTFSGSTNLANFGLGSTNRVYSINLNETHIFSPTVISEFRAGFGRTSPLFHLETTVPLGPRIQFINNQISSFGHFEGGPQGRFQNTYQIGDTVSWSRSAHNVKAGGDLFRYQLNGGLDSDIRGRYTFLNWDDFAAGRPNGFTQRFGSTARGFRTWLTGAFVQDDYRIRKNLTLNLGFRMEVYGAVSEVNKLTSNLFLDCQDSLGAAGSGPLGCIRTGLNAINTNKYAQPRIGFAWNPRGGRTVIRGGYGLVADFNFLNPITNQRSLPPLVVNQNLTGIGNFTGGNTWANLVAGTAPIQQQGLAQVGRLRTDLLNYGDLNPVLDPNLDNPQVHDWSFGIQHELPKNIVMKVTYVGTKGNFLQRARQLNLNANRPRAATSIADETARLQEFTNSFNALTGIATRGSNRRDPRFNVVNFVDNSANSNYHGLEVLATRPFKAGYSLQVAYTYAKSIDDVSDQLSTIPNDSTLLQDPENARGNRSLSGFDIAHRAVITHVWELPWGKRLSSNFARQLLGGWGMSGISSFRSGFPIAFEAVPRLGLQNISGITNGGLGRANAAGSFAFNPQPAGSAAAPNGLNTDPVAGRRISAHAESLGLTQPLLGNYGTLGRNTHRANGVVNFDWNVYKTMTVNDRVRVKLRCEIYNVFNHHAFRDVTRNITSPSFGQYTTSELAQRWLQLGAIVQF